MDDEKCLRDEARMLAIERIAHDANARRELLWLRAKELEDEEMARDLEQIDPGLLGRMRDVVDGLETLGASSPSAQRTWFARQWHACHDRHLGDLDAVACACSRCIICREC